MSNSCHLSATNLSRIYQRGPQTISAVDNVTLKIKRGEFLAVVGASGSGKSTLLNLLAGLDTPTSGNVDVDGQSLHQMSRRGLANYRAHSVGMVFQSFNLIPHRSALANVELALYFDDTPRQQRQSKASEVLTRLGLAERLDHRPADLSGGEQQRVAIARALVKKPDILFADEPTGNLDHDNSEQIGELLRELNSQGLTIVMVTHDLSFARSNAKRVVKMSYGSLQESDETVSLDEAVPPEETS